MEVVETVKRTEKWLRRLYEERRTNVEVVETVKRTEKWLRRLYEERRTMWRLLRLETHLRSKKILVSKQLCCRMHNHMRATDLCHIALVYTYNSPRLNKPITISVLCEA